MPSTTRRLPHALAVLAIVVFAIWCAYALRGDLTRVSLSPALHAWRLGVVAVALSLLNYLLRIVRWRWYLRRLGHPLTLRFASLTYLAGFSFTLSPGKVGEMARARYYMEVGIPLPDVAAAFCVERMMDLLAMLALAALVLNALPHYDGAVWTAAGVTGAALLVLTVTPWRRLELHVRGAGGMPAWAARPIGAVAGTLATARSLQRIDLLAGGFAIALAAWACEGLGLFTLASMFPSVHLEPAVGVGIYAVAVLVGALSFLPGGLGSTEAMMTTLLATQGYPVAAAFLITMVCRIVTLWLAVLLGWSALAVLRQRPVGAVATWP